MLVVDTPELVIASMENDFDMVRISQFAYSENKVEISSQRHIKAMSDESILNKVF